MTPTPGDEHGRDGAVADDIDGPVDPLEGLMDPEEGVNTPAGEADAPPPG